MPRPKGSKNKVKADKPVKVLTPESTSKGKRGRPKGAVKAVKVQAVPFQEQIKEVLFHVLELFKASLLDAFRQYLESRIRASQPASVEEFTDKFKHTMSLHGLSKETLLGALNPVELEYLEENIKRSQQLRDKLQTMETQPVAQPVAQPVQEAISPAPQAATQQVELKLVQKEESKQEAISVFDALDMV